jgi:phosphoribosylformylglycinamidine synthase
LSEGGLAVALAEMAFAGGLGVRVELGSAIEPVVALFSESNTRFVCEVEVGKSAAFEKTLAGVPLAKIGNVADDSRLLISTGGKPLVDADIAKLKEAWQAPLKW